MEIIAAQRHRAKRWRVLLPLGIGTVLALTGDLTLYAVLPAYAAGREFSLAAIGLLLSANRLIRLGSNPLVGLLLAGARRRAFVLSGFGLGALSTLLYVAAQDTSLFLVGRLLWGISWSLMYIGSYVMMMDICHESERGWGSGILQGFYFIALAFDPLLGGLLSDRMGFVPALSVCAALSAAGFLIASFTLPETLAAPEQPARSPFLVMRHLWQGWGHKLTAILRFTAVPFSGREIRYFRESKLLNAQNLAAGYVYFAANFVGDGILLSTLSLFLRNRYGSSIPLNGWVLPIATSGGLLLAMRAVISALVAPLAGSLSDLAGEPYNLIHHTRRRWASVGWGVAITAAGLVLLAGLANPWALLTGVGLAAAGAAVVLTISPPLVREINPDQESGTVLGLLANAADLGLALAPLATYALLDRLSLENIYLLSALGLAAGLPMIWFLRRRA